MATPRFIAYAIACLGTVAGASCRPTPVARTVTDDASGELVIDASPMAKKTDAAAASPDVASVDRAAAGGADVLPASADRPVAVDTMSFMPPADSSVSESDATLPLVDAAVLVPPTAAQLLRIAGTCKEISMGRYKMDVEETAKVPVCGLKGAVFWQADMDITCNGKETSTCNDSTDSGFKPRTAVLDSAGQPLDAVSVPYLVIPMPTTRFDYTQSDIHPGAVAAIIYDNKIAYGIFGEVGDPDLIGEGSFGLADLLGIDPDPETGGADGGVTYIVFTGTDAVVSKPEDSDQAIRLGKMRAAQAVKDN